MGLVVVATALSHSISKGKYQADVEKASSKIIKVLAWLPTIGVNQRTKVLEGAVKKMQEKEPELPRGANQ